MLQVTPTNSPSELLQKFALIADLELDAVADSSGRPHSKVSTRHTYCSEVSRHYMLLCLSKCMNALLTLWDPPSSPSVNTCLHCPSVHCPCSTCVCSADSSLLVPRLQRPSAPAPTPSRGPSHAPSSSSSQSGKLVLRLQRERTQLQKQLRYSHWHNSQCAV